MTLRGRTIAISISDAPDRARLGFPESEIERVLFSVCMGLIRAGARILYAGNLDPSDYTFKMFRHIAGAYASPNDGKPFIHLIPKVVLKSVSKIKFERMLRESRAMAESKVLVGEEAVDAVYETPEEDASANLTRIRKYMTRVTDARVIMGGKMGIVDVKGDDFKGHWPGILEEAFFTLKADEPLIALGAFGGAARDAAIALGLLDSDLRIPRGNQQAGYHEAFKALTTFAPQFKSHSQLAQLRQLAEEENSEILANKIPRVLAKALTLTPRLTSRLQSQLSHTPSNRPRPRPAGGG